MCSDCTWQSGATSLLFLHHFRCCSVFKDNQSTQGTHVDFDSHSFDKYFSYLPCANIVLDTGDTVVNKTMEKEKASLFLQRVKSEEVTVLARWTCEGRLFQAPGAGSSSTPKEGKASAWFEEQKEVNVPGMGHGVGVGRT